jgi:hypothetical protein
MPHFDYCSTLFCYFPKATIQKIHNTCNYIISKLLNLNATVDSNNFNVLLENYGLAITFSIDYLLEWQFEIIFKIKLMLHK